jgi:hypothetical protein
MVTAINPETESKSAVAETAEAPAQPAAVDVSAIPETPAELLTQWEASRKPSVQATIVASFVALYNIVAGPGTTSRARLEREIAETRGYRDGFIKLA